MTMHTERYCRTLGSLGQVEAIRAIHEAYLQLLAMRGAEVDGLVFDVDPALSSLRDCLSAAGHPAAQAI